MPALDVTDILTDPDFIDFFNVSRYGQTITSGGMTLDTPTVFNNVSGVVTANDNVDLLKMPDGEILTGSITICTKFRLTNGSGALDADVVLWHGRTYQVKTVGDWSGYGAGFIEAVCLLNEVSDLPNVESVVNSSNSTTPFALLLS